MFSFCKILGFFIVSNTHAVNSTDTLPKKIAQGLEKWSAANPSEKVFVHTDKNIYFAGENIWYKAYLTLEGGPSILSKIVYVDLVDESGKVVEKQMRPLSNGNSAGDIIIPNSLPTGNYSLNAYSLWMLNYHPFVFTKNIRIYNAELKQANPKKGTGDFIVNFFPEGGDLIEGLKSNIAFYAVNQQGLPLDVAGTITDQSNKAIGSITTAKLGYGKFEVTPAPGEILTATVTANGVERKFKLPQAKKEGINLRVNNTGASNIFVKLERNVANTSTLNNVLVVAQIHGKLAFMGMVNFNENATGMAISKKNLPPGILQITAFDTTGAPLAERLAFINNYEIPEVSLQMDSMSLQAKGKNKFKIDLSKFSAPSVSIAINDAEMTSAPGTEDNILSSLLLTSDLKGYIHQPGSYFQSKDAAVTGHIDLLMLTHGWRRFKWDDVINKRDVALRFPVESGIGLMGKVTIPGSTKTVSGGHVDIITKGEDSTTILSKAVINNKGEFFIDDLNFKQRATVYLQGSKASNQNANVDIIVTKSFIDTLKRSPNKPTVDLDIYTTITNESNKMATLMSEPAKGKVYTLEDVKVTAKKTSRIDSLNNNYASTLFQLGQSLELTSTHYLSIWQFLREQVSGLTVEGDLINPTVSFSRFAGLSAPSIAADDDEGTNQAGGMESNGITYYLNEINVSKDVIASVHPSDVALIKVFKGPEGAALGMNEGGIAIYTKKGLPTATRPGEKGFFNEKKLGYSVTREFFNPDYSGVINPGLIDKRTTLYWAGNTKVDKSGMATIRFYNNDITKKYKVTIQGIDKAGTLIFKELIIQ